MEHAVEVDLITKLNTLAEQFRTSFENINSGGCGVVAAIIGTYLKRRNIPVVIRIADYSPNGKTIDAVRNRIFENRMTNRGELPSIYEWYDYGIGFVHVIAEFEYEGKKYHFDSNGCVPASDVDPTFKLGLIEGHLTIDEGRLVAASDYWNSTFRRRQIPSMMKLAYRFFNKQFAF